MKKLSELGIGIRYTVGNVDLILVILSIVFKTKSIHLPVLHLMQSSSVDMFSLEFYVLTSLGPCYFLFFVSFVRVNVRLHPTGK